MLQMSYDRIRDLVPPDRVLVLTNQAFADRVREQLAEIPPDNIVGEPMRKDTSAAVGLAAALCRKRFGNPVIVTLTADHTIEPVSVFQKTLLSAVRQAAADGALYTFGIQPTYPATGYGYLERGALLYNDDGIEHYELRRFKEKPPLEAARQYVDSGKFYWNSGMFVWRTDTIWRALETHLPGHVKALERAAAFDRTPDWQQALKEAFEGLPRVSIDYGVMEKADRVCCVASKFSWNDVGGWLALRDYLPDDGRENRCRARAIVLDASGNTVFCEQPEETVMLVGVKDLVIVRAAEGMLIAHKDRVEDVKKLVEAMQKDRDT
ncbi:MAG: mannose-1-phosphate guanylyltransferase [Deltaproteobacteria bacterium]|nr:mannose-1-phosphate guanylyltransferase [Deltaproteobacteria bacterium]